MEKTIKYPIGIQDFGEIIRGGYVYVDKTALMGQLIAGGKYYFLSRPRRFGKSLLLSTIAAYFEGKKDLFEGLAIAETTREWPEGHPVLYLDLGGKEYKTYPNLQERLNLHLVEWERLYGSNPAEVGVDDRFYGIIRRACEKTGRQAVILIDEYDKLLLEAMHDEGLHEEYRSTLRGVYGNLKTCDRFIRFAMLTGVTKFSKLSLFSDLNNLNDISMKAEYATLCGITERELDIYFAQDVEAFAERCGMSVAETRERLRRHYDGYLFEEDAQRVYNPFSLLNALDDKKFRAYWFATGTPDFLTEMMRRENFNLLNLSTHSIAEAKFTSLDPLRRDPLPILYQSGYLTIDRCDDKGRYFLRFPNEEVERGFLQELLPRYAPASGGEGDALIASMVDHVRAGEPKEFMLELQALLADTPYEKSEAGEKYFRNLLFIIFRLLGFYCEVEHALAGGRSDVVIKTDLYIYVLELKVDKSPEAALRQMEKKGYTEPYVADKRKLFKIGVNFSSAKERIDKWRVVEA